MKSEVHKQLAVAGILACPQVEAAAAAAAVSCLRQQSKEENSIALQMARSSTCCCISQLAASMDGRQGREGMSLRRVSGQQQGKSCRQVNPAFLLLSLVIDGKGRGAQPKFLPSSRNGGNRRDRLLEVALPRGSGPNSCLKLPALDAILGRRS